MRIEPEGQDHRSDRNSGRCPDGDGIAASGVVGAADGSEATVTPAERIAAEREQLEELIAAPFCLLEFTATWCVVSHLLAGRFDETSRYVTRVDVDVHPGLADRFSVQLLPCWVVLRDGRETGRLVGAHSAEEISAVLDGDRSGDGPNG